MTPVATARLSESARPACGMRSSRSQRRGEIVGQPLLLVAHQQEHRPAGIVDRAVVDRALEVGAGDEPGKFLPPGKELRRRRSRNRNGEDRTHRGPHRLQRERVGGLADQDQPLGADRVDGADDGAEIAGVADTIERHPDIVAGRADVFQRQIFLGEHADHHLRIVAPRDRRQHLLADFEHQPAGRDRAGRGLLHRGIAEPDLANTSVLIDQPRSSASMTSFSPSAMKACCSSRNFFSDSALMSLTSGLARLVTSLTWPGAPGRGALMPPPSARTARSTARGRPTFRE